ncbi:MAG TPA: MFS transporter [Gemmatimonadales bacterium]|nr:MFS transporter [Gemmatimonadales bacterium]
MSERRRHGVPGTVKGLSVVSLFNDFASEMVYPLLPALVTGPLGAGALALGALDGAAELAAAALKVVSGRLADRPRWRAPLILGGYATAVLVRPLIAVAGAAWQVVGFRVIDRVGKGLRTPARDAWIAGITPPELRGRAFGFHRAADHFGAVVGSLAAWLLLEQGLAVRDVIGWSAAPGVLAFLILALLLRRSVPSAVPAVKAGPDPPSDARGRAFWAPILLLAALTFLRVPEALLLLRLQDLGVAVAAVPLVWAALHVVRSASSYPGGWMADRLGPRAAVSSGGLLFALVAAALALRLSPAGAVAAFLVLGAVAGLTEAAERALVAWLAPVRTGRGFGSYHALVGVAALPAGLAFGALYQELGGPVALRISAVGMLLAVGVWMGITSATTGAGREGRARMADEDGEG